MLMCFEFQFFSLSIFTSLPLKLVFQPLLFKKMCKRSGGRQNDVQWHSSLTTSSPLSSWISKWFELAFLIFCLLVLFCEFHRKMLISAQKKSLLVNTICVCEFFKFPERMTIIFTHSHGIFKKVSLFCHIKWKSLKLFWMISGWKKSSTKNVQCGSVWMLRTWLLFLDRK